MSSSGVIHLLSQDESVVDTVGGLLDTNYGFEIPLNQRALSWRAVDLKTLWTDLLEATITGNPHFMGFMVFENRRQNRKRILVVQDGQQRLMCLLAIAGILYRAIADDPNAASEANSLRRWIDNHGTPRLVLDHHHHHLSELILSGKAGPHSGTEPLTAKRFASAFKSLEQEIQDFTSKKTKPELKTWVHTFVRTLQEQVYLISLMVESPALALRVFDRLNASGVKLSQADIVKNMLYQAALDKGQQESQISTQWDNLVTTVPFANVTTFLHYWAQFQDCESYAEKDLPEAVRARIEADPISFLKALNLSAKHLREWWDCSQTSATVDKSVAENLKLIGRPQLAYPLLWRASELRVANLISDAELASLAKSLERYIFRELVVTQRKTSEIEQHLISATAELIENGPTKSQGVLRNRSNDEEFSTHFSNWTVREVKKQFYTLREIERFLGSGSPSPGTSYTWQDDKRTRAWEVEHISPKAPRKGAGSSKPPSNPRTVELNRVGNLVLLEKALNNHVKDKSFVEKKKVYKDGFSTKRKSHSGSQMIAVSGPVPKQVGKKKYRVLTDFSSKTFGDKEIIERQNELAALAPEIWRI